MVTLRSRENRNSKCPSAEAADEQLNREQRLKLAMSAMNESHGMVYTEAVKLFDVKRSTLHDHMSSKCSKFTKGRYPLLTAVEERALLEMLRNLHAKGYAITSYVCRRAAFLYAKRCNYSLSRTAQQMAGRKWFSGFVKRNNVTISNVTKMNSDRRCLSKRRSGDAVSVGRTCSTCC